MMHHANLGSLAFSNADAALAQLGRYTADLKKLVREKDAALQAIEQAQRGPIEQFCLDAFKLTQRRQLGRVLLPAPVGSAHGVVSSAVRV